MHNNTTINITVRPAKLTSRGQTYDALHQGQHLATSRTPFHAAARKLVEQGHDPDAVLVMRHEGKDMDCLKQRLGTAAKLALEENDRKGFRLRPYRERPERPF